MKTVFRPSFLPLAMLTLASACAARSTSPQADATRRDADLRALEARSCPERADEELASTLGTQLDVDVVPVGGDVFAIYSGLCQRMVSGAYNPTGAVVWWGPSGIEFVRIDAAPWLPDSETFSDTRTLFHARLDPSDGGLMLTSGMHGRGIGDSGFWVLSRWHADHFVPIELRSRDGGSFLVEDTHPFPIVAPVERRCSFELAVDANDARVATIERLVGSEAQQSTFALEDSSCAASARDSIACGAESFAPVAEYTAIPTGDDWSVVRVDGESQREVFRVPRGCAL